MQKKTFRKNQHFGKDSKSANIAADEITLRKILAPKLDILMDYGTPRNIEIKDDKLLVNGVSLGKYAKMSNFTVCDDALLMFDYGNHRRCVWFGERFYGCCDRVRMILQDDKAVYSDFSTAPF